MSLVGASKKGAKFARECMVMHLLVAAFLLLVLGLDLHVLLADRLKFLDQGT